MKKPMLKLTLGLFAAAIAFAPVLSQAQPTTPAAPAQTEPSTPKKHDRAVFRGTISTVDTNAMTLTVGKRTFNITSDTKITKNGKPAVLSDLVAGDKVGGAYKKTDDGKMNATTVNVGKKSGDEEK